MVPALRELRELGSPNSATLLGLTFFSSFSERFVLTLRAKPPFGLFGGGLAIFAII